MLVVIKLVYKLVVEFGINVSKSSHSTFYCIKPSKNNSLRLFLLLHFVLLATSVSHSATGIMVFHPPAGFSYSRNVLFPQSMKPPSDQRGHTAHFWACWLSHRAPSWWSRLCLRASSGVSLLELPKSRGDLPLVAPLWAASVWLSGAKCLTGSAGPTDLLFSFHSGSLRAAWPLLSVVLRWSCDHFFLKEEVHPCYLLEICCRSSNFSNTHTKDWTALFYNAIYSLMAPTPHLSKP